MATNSPGHNRTFPRGNGGSVILTDLAIGMHVFDVPRNSVLWVMAESTGGTVDVEYTYDAGDASNLSTGTAPSQSFTAAVANANWGPGASASATAEIQGPVTAVQITVAGSATNKITIARRGHEKAVARRRVSDRVYEQLILGDSPYAYWRFSEGTGTTAATRVGPSTRDLTVSSGAWRPGIIGINAMLSSVTHVGNVTGQGMVPATQAMSVEMWINQDSGVYDTDYFISQPQVLSGTSGMNISHNGSGTMIFRFRAGGAYGVVNMTGFNQEEDTHVVMTYDGANVRAYMNNVAGTPAALTGNLESASDDLYVGRFSNAFGGAVNATIDEVAIYHSVLTPAQVSNHYLTGLQVKN